jgi:hypothetical protein
VAASYLPAILLRLILVTCESLGDSAISAGSVRRRAMLTSATRAGLDHFRIGQRC